MAAGRFADERRVDTPPEKTRKAERLGSTLFVAALVHAVVILGVTFTAVPLTAPPLPTLKVTLLIDSETQTKAPRDAEFLANRDQAAMGEAADGLRPSTALSAENFDARAGDPLGADAVDGRPQEQRLDIARVATRSASDRLSPAEPPSLEEHSDAPRHTAVLVDELAPQTLVADLDLLAQLPGTDGRSPVAAPSAQQSALAQYLDRWRRRVERVGTANFPEQFLGNLSHGRPTLEVLIGIDGRLEDIVVRRSSGDRALDQAALKILSLAAPFEPLPEQLAAEYRALRFAYEWDFHGGLAQAAAGTGAAVGL
jgi:protein TonB